MAIVAALLLVVVGVTSILIREARPRNRLQDELNQLASTDGLTGLANRRAFDRALDREWRVAQSEASEVAPLMPYADHFKRFNDRPGYQAGDAVLQHIAATPAPIARRPADCAARYGGEEFALLVPGTSSGSAVGIAVGIRARVDPESKSGTPCGADCPRGRGALHGQARRTKRVQRWREK